MQPANEPLAAEGAVLRTDRCPVVATAASDGVAPGLGCVSEVVAGTGVDLVASGSARDDVRPASGFDAVVTATGDDQVPVGSAGEGLLAARTGQVVSPGTARKAVCAGGADQPVVARTAVQGRPFGIAMVAPGPRTTAPISAKAESAPSPVKAVTTTPSGAGGPQRASCAEMLAQNGPVVMAAPASAIRTPSGSGTILSSFLSPGAATKVTSRRGWGK
jgi:hypothetical protein